jgi:hypothetical protein
MLTEPRRWPRLALMAGAAVLVVVVFVLGRATAGGESSPVAPGPRRVVTGVGVGFARSEAGAEAAAAHYLLELERAIDTLEVARAATVASVVATSGEARVFEAHAAAAIAVERSGGVPLRRVAVSTDPVFYSRGRAGVTVLESWIYAAAAREALWAIERVTLVWQRGDWRVSAIAGAAPSANESLAELRAQLEFPGVGDASVR